jgi:hypothetical protein
MPSLRELEAQERWIKADLVSIGIFGALNLLYLALIPSESKPFVGKLDIAIVAVGFAASIVWMLSSTKIHRSKQPIINFLIGLCVLIVSVLRLIHIQ